MKSGHGRVRRRASYGLALVGLAAALGVGAWTLRGHWAPAEAVPVASEPTTTATPEPTAAVVVLPLPRDPTTPVPTTSQSAAQPGAVQVHASAPVTSLSIAGRTMVLASPATDLTIERSGAEKSSAVRVVVVAADGRLATSSLRPEATSLELTFPPRAATTPTPNRAHSAAPGLAPSPYGH
jgi:hypothetical protein